MPESGHEIVEGRHRKPSIHTCALMIHAEVHAQRDRLTHRYVASYSCKMDCTMPRVLDPHRLPAFRDGESHEDGPRLSAAGC